MGQLATAASAGRVRHSKGPTPKRLACTTPLHMPHLSRIVFVPPLIAVTFVVAVLNGNVLCMAGGDHVAVEARHDGDCHDSDPCPAEDGPSPASEGCDDVTADFDLSREGERDGVDASAAPVPHVWGTVFTSAAIIVNPAVLSPRATAAPPPRGRASPVRTVVLVL